MLLVVGCLWRVVAGAGDFDQPSTALFHLAAAVIVENNLLPTTRNQPMSFLVAIKLWSDPIPSRTRPSNTVLPMVVPV